MAYLLDSDVVTDHLAADAETRRLVALLIPEDVAISMISYMEIFQGVVASTNAPEAHAELAAFLANVPVVPFSAAVAERCARLRANLQRQGKRVRPRALDLLTAATALEHGLTLVTRNLADYVDIPHLALYRPNRTR